MARNKLTFSNKISSEYRTLINLCKKSEHKIDAKQIKQAFIIACDHSKSEQGIEDEETLFYGLKLAQYVAEYIELGTIPITAAMLYKFIEKKKIPISVLDKECKSGIVPIINDLIRIQKIDVSNISKDAENHRKLLLTSISDIRVILIRLAEMLYVLANQEINYEEQVKLAIEAMNIYAPIGHKLGLYKLKSEIEDLSFKHLHSATYHLIEQKLKDTADERDKLVRNFISPIKEQLDTQDLKYEIKSRTKSVYSIWNKMKNQKVDFEEVYDVFAIRVIIDCPLKEEKNNCWKVFSIVTNLYQPSPERMRDWITVPKSQTGYESLHATVLEPKGKWIEVQIRTERMNEIAEKGLAAHWKYKGHNNEGDFDIWLNRMREIIEQPDVDITNQLDQLNQERYTKDIFVFTPKGELRKLPKGATVLDFAYEIHSGVGDTCSGAKVNGRVVPIRYLLNNGDRVEIFTQKNQKPKFDWLDFVVTSKAQAKIRHALNEELIAQAEQGKEVFKRRLRNWKIPFTDILVNRVIEHLKLKTSLDFYSNIANEKINLTHLKDYITTNIIDESKPAERIGAVALHKVIPSLVKQPEDLLIIDGKMRNVVYKLSPCCNPIFGDDVFGFVTVNEGIKVHRINCPNAQQMIDLYGYRMIKAQWAGYQDNAIFRAGIKIKGIDEIGIMSKITDAISKDMKVNMQSITLDTKDGYFEGIIKLLVKDNLHLESLINILLKIKGVENISRIDVI